MDGARTLTASQDPWEVPLISCSTDYEVCKDNGQKNPSIETEEL